MKHIKLIENEQLLDQISGGKAAPAFAAVARPTVKGVIGKLLSELKSFCNQKTQVARLL